MSTINFYVRINKNEMKKWEVSNASCDSVALKVALRVQGSSTIPATAEHHSDMRTRKAKAKAKVNTPSDAGIDEEISTARTLATTAFAVSGATFIWNVIAPATTLFRKKLTIK